MEMQRNVVLAPYTTFGIGGTADYFAVAQTSDDLLDALRTAKAKNLPYFVLGSGANILMGDKGFRGFVIKNEARAFEFSGNMLLTESGAKIGDIIKVAAKKGLSGFEHFAGIPSTVGGALWQNLHFLSPDRKKTMYIGDLLKSATILSATGEIKKVTKDYFQFDYDQSILHTSGDVVLIAQFTFTQEDPAVIHERITANLAWREEKHPVEAWKNSAGSVFKKIEGHGSGRLIEQVGLKGHKIGGAQISDKHANFIINTGNASAKDIRELISLVQEKVKKELNLDMQVEISFVGEF